MKEVYVWYCDIQNVIHILDPIDNLITQMHFGFNSNNAIYLGIL